jgi:hypothetical protein
MSFADNFQKAFGEARHRAMQKQMLEDRKKYQQKQLKLSTARLDLMDDKLYRGESRQARDDVKAGELVRTQFYGDAPLESGVFNKEPYTAQPGLLQGDTSAPSKSLEDIFGSGAQNFVQPTEIQLPRTADVDSEREYYVDPEDPQAPQKEDYNRLFGSIQADLKAWEANKGDPTEYYRSAARMDDLDTEEDESRKERVVEAHLKGPKLLKSIEKLNALESFISSGGVGKASELQMKAKADKAAAAAAKKESDRDHNLAVKALGIQQERLEQADRHNNQSLKLKHVEILGRMQDKRGSGDYNNLSISQQDNAQLAAAVNFHSSSKIGGIGNSGESKQLIAGMEALGMLRETVDAQSPEMNLGIYSNFHQYLGMNESQIFDRVVKSQAELRKDLEGKDLSPEQAYALSERAQYFIPKAIYYMGQARDMYLKSGKPLSAIQPHLNSVATASWDYSIALERKSVAEKALGAYKPLEVLSTIPTPYDPGNQVSLYVDPIAKKNAIQLGQLQSAFSESEANFGEARANLREAQDNLEEWGEENQKRSGRDYNRDLLNMITSFREQGNRRGKRTETGRAIRPYFK